MTGVLSIVALAWSFGVASVAARAAACPSRPILRKRVYVEGAVLVRPCAGGEQNLDRTLASTALLRASFPVAVRFAVASITDGAYPIACRARARLVSAGLDARVVVTGATGPNRKADQIGRTLAVEPDAAPIVIIADSDVDLEGLGLDDLVSPLANGSGNSSRDASVVAAWAPPVEVSPVTWGDRASAAVLDASLHAFAVLSALDGGGMVGKLVAIRRSALDRVGGFDALVGHLGEDMELGRRLRAAGGRVVVAPVFATSLAQGRKVRDVIERYARWVSVIRAQRPALLPSYPALFAATPCIIVLSAVAMVNDGVTFVGAGAMALAIAGRLAVAWLARRRSERPLCPLRLMLDACAADVLLLAAFAVAVTQRTASWRGVRLHLGSGGTLERETP